MPTRLPYHTTVTRRAILRLLLPASIFTALGDLALALWSTCRLEARAA